MNTWKPTVSDDGITLSLGKQPILTKVVAVVAIPGEPLVPMVAGKETFAGIPFGRDLLISALPSEHDPQVLLIRAKYCGGPVDGQAGIQLHIGGWGEVARAMALARPNLYWLVPHWLDDLSQMPAQTQLLLVRRHARRGKYLAILPLTDGGMRGELRAIDGKAGLVSVSLDSRYTPGGFVLGALAVGDDPYELVERLFVAGLREQNTGRRRVEKPVPPIVDDFGWCSWNAFYENVTEDDILAVLKTFAVGKLPVGSYILDDGWQSVAKCPATRENGEVHQPAGLAAFAPNEKFPHGLSGLIRKIKQQTGLRHFGVWHAFQGYWGGIHPASPLARNYQTYRDIHGHTLVAPDDTYRFYQDYHAYLREHGVDFVKVDNQSGTDINVRDRYPVGHAARVMHQALDGSVAVQFGGQIINCMSMSSDILLQLPLTNVVRNSDDYDPWRPNNPGEHVAHNAFNNLFTGQVAVPDWDMFESHHPYGEFHAMARAVSGSPIYCTDYPGRQDFALLRKLVLSDGRALRCPQPAQVTADCLFADPQNEPVLLKIGNTLPTGHGVLGIFNCRVTPDVVETPGQPFTFTDEQRRALAADGVFSPSDIPALRAAHYAVYSHRTGVLTVLARQGKNCVRLSKYDSDVLVLAPIKAGVAVLGLLDKFNSSAAIGAWSVDGKQLLAQLIDGGTVGFYVECRPRKITIDGKLAKRFHYDKTTGLVTVELRPGKPATVMLSF